MRLVSHLGKKKKTCFCSSMCLGCHAHQGPLTPLHRAPPGGRIASSPPRGLSSMAASGWPDVSHVGSGLPRYVSQNESQAGAALPFIASRRSQAALLLPYFINQGQTPPPVGEWQGFRKSQGMETFLLPFVVQSTLGTHRKESFQILQELVSYYQEQFMPAESMKLGIFLPFFPLASRKLREECVAFLQPRPLQTSYVITYLVFILFSYHYFLFAPASLTFKTPCCCACILLSCLNKVRCRY